MEAGLSKRSMSQTSNCGDSELGLGRVGGLRRTICHVVPLWGFQIGEICVLFEVGIAGVVDGELALGGDADEKGRLRKWRPRGMPTAIPMTALRRTTTNTHLHARPEDLALKGRRLRISAAWREGPGVSCWPHSLSPRHFGDDFKGTTILLTI